MVATHRVGWRLLRGGRAVLAAACIVFTASGCAYFGDDNVVEASDVEPAESIYERAEEQFRAGFYKEAAKTYDEVERLHPTSQFTKLAVIKSAQSSFREGDFAKSILAANRFLEYYPSDEKAPFAQYIIAMSYYNQITDVDRDQSVTRSALQSFRELVNRYPDSEYAREAQLRMDLTIDQLAGREMTVGRYYLQRREYIGAINRFRTVVEKYQNTTHTPEALHRLVEAYLALGVKKEAKTAAAVLGYNFPGSDWYRDSFELLTGQDLTPEEDEESWISRVWRRVGRGQLL